MSSIYILLRLSSWDLDFAYRVSVTFLVFIEFLLGLKVTEYLKVEREHRVYNWYSCLSSLCANFLHIEFVCKNLHIEYLFKILHIEYLVQNSAYRVSPQNSAYRVSREHQVYRVSKPKVCIPSIYTRILLTEFLASTNLPSFVLG